MYAISQTWLSTNFNEDQFYCPILWLLYVAVQVHRVYDHSNEYILIQPFPQTQLLSVIVIVLLLERLS